MAIGHWGLMVQASTAVGDHVGLCVQHAAPAVAAHVLLGGTPHGELSRSDV